MSTQVVRIQEKGQVTIPLQIRRKLKLRKGDYVSFSETENGVMIKPAEVLVAEKLDKIGKVLKEKGIDLDELIESGREVRQEILQRKIRPGDRLTVGYFWIPVFSTLPLTPQPVLPES